MRLSTIARGGAVDGEVVVFEGGAYPAGEGGSSVIGRARRCVGSWVAPSVPIPVGRAGAAVWAARGLSLCPSSVGSTPPVFP